MTDIDPNDRGAARERRGALLGLKLRALVRDHLDDPEVPEAVAFAPGAALLHRDEAWVYLDDEPTARLGAALAWTIRSGAAVLHVVAEQGTGVLARRAEQFSLPISVWHAVERSLVPAVPEPIRPPAPVPDAHETLRQRIVEGGAEPVVEHGVLVGEVHGLEVCRVVDDPFTGSTRLEVGVGAHDREAFQIIHGDIPAVESLARISDAVARHRVPGALPHPLNRLAAERLIRWRLEQQPELVGARRLAASSPPVPRTNLKDPVPCVATGEGVDGGTVVVVCASGVDLDLIPFAADARLAAEEAATPGVGRGIRLVVAIPSRDRVRVIDELAGLLREPVEFVAVD